MEKRRKQKTRNNATSSEIKWEGEGGRERRKKTIRHGSFNTREEKNGNRIRWEKPEKEYTEEAKKKNK